MNFVFFTIVLDGMPFIKWHLPIFSKIKRDWRWIIIEGSSGNEGSTRWCRPQAARVSQDGTNEYLDTIKDSRVLILHGAWSSKDKMVNEALRIADEVTEGPRILMEIDVDEIHKSESLEKVAELFTNDQNLGAILFPCRYFVGPKLICQGSNCWSNWDKEYARAWKYTAGARFVSHEPPVLNVTSGRTMGREEAASHGLTFDHLAYVTEKQVAYKSEFYSAEYADGLNQWKALQRNQNWPAKLSRFFPWVHGDLPTVRKTN